MLNICLTFILPFNNIAPLKRPWSGSTADLTTPQESIQIFKPPLIACSLEPAPFIDSGLVTGIIALFDNVQVKEG
jgi:hypothetical protein